MIKFLTVLLAIGCATAVLANASEDARDIQFESLLIQGEIKRPDLTVVTGDGGEEQDGLLRLRKDFLDLMAQDAGEAIE